MLSTDYLIVGGGAFGMTFADQMLTETGDELVIVDRRHMPGGHWNDSYPFVRLHQPSAFYGVGSRALGANRVDADGFNKGYFEMASGAEVLSYFDQLMHARFLPSGRVRYFPMCEHTEDGRIVSALSGETQHIEVRKKIVDAAFFQTSVPATHIPNFTVADGVTLIPPNRLPQMAVGFQRFVIVGGGKTAMDAGVWLLHNGVAADRVQWIIPRDFWLIDRESVQPGDAFANRFDAAIAAQLEAAAEAADAHDYFARLEAARCMLRLDPAIRPEAYRCATISRAEIALLRRIRDVVRKGRVRRIEPDAIMLDGGETPSAPGRLYIDCTASAIVDRPPQPVFDGDRITIQTVRGCLISLSAAVIAHVEAAYGSEAEKNDLCRAIPVPRTPADGLRTALNDLRAQQRWNADPALRQWLAAHRLSGMALRTRGGAPDPEAEAIRQRIKAARPRAMANLERLLGR